MKASSVWFSFAGIALFLAAFKIIDDYLPFYSCIIIYNVYLAQGD